MMNTHRNQYGEHLPVEGEGREVKKMVEGIFYCKFDPQQGPTLVHSEPSNLVSDFKLNFKVVSRYFLPDGALGARSISIKLDVWTICGTPVEIVSEKYLRNIFKFCLCFVLRDPSILPSVRLLAERVANLLKRIELDTFTFSTLHGENKIKELLCVLLRQLNFSERIHLKLGYYDELRLVISPLSLKNSNSATISAVPVCVFDLLSYITFNKETAELHLSGDAKYLAMLDKLTPFPLAIDMTIYQVLLCIDGMRTIRDISVTGMIEEAKVITCVNHLVACEAVVLLDKFDMTNRYFLTKEFQKVWMNEKVVSMAAAYIVGGDAVAEELASMNVEPMPVVEIMELYSSLALRNGQHTNTSYDLDVAGYSQSLLEFAKASEDILSYYRISLRHFIAFGQIHGFLHRMHEFPVIDAENSCTHVDDLYALPESHLPSDSEQMMLEVPMENFSSTSSADLLLLLGKSKNINVRESESVKINLKLFLPKVCNGLNSLDFIAAVIDLTKIQTLCCIIRLAQEESRAMTMLYK